MEDSECPPVTVEGDWSPEQNKTVKNKLQLYFQSKKKSSGGDCRVEVEEEAPTASVFFRSQEVRERVLAKKHHEISVGNKALTLRLSSAPGGGASQSPPSSRDVASDPAADSKNQKSEPEKGASATNQTGLESGPRSTAVVLENVQENLSQDLLQMMVETISGLDENDFSLEIIWETNMAVLIFNSPADAEKFVSVSQTNSKMKRHRLTARPLEAAKSIRMESLPPSVVKDMIELWFEKHWELPEDVVMIPDDQAAIVTFRDSKVVTSVCVKEDHVMRSIAVKLYPYYESLGTALYGKERPAWKMPEPVTEKVQRVIWKFLLQKKMLKSINNQMHPHFCSVDLDHPEVKLSPLPSFLKQKGLTAKDVDNWAGMARAAFCRLMSEYTAFESDVNTEAWKAAEKEVRSVVREDALVDFDPSRDVVTIAGRTDDIKKIRAPVENIIRKLISHVQRQTKSITELLEFSLAYFAILKEEGLQKAASDISPELKVSFNEGTGKLSLTGLPEEVYKTKSWILERNMSMRRKQLNLPPSLLDYLRSVDSTDMSMNLFTSQGISAVYCIDSKGVSLVGSSDRALADAESKMKKDLLVQTLDVPDQGVLSQQKWMDLNRDLLDTYNFSNKKTVIIWIHPERRDKVTVVGFSNPVKEVSVSLRQFIEDYSQVRETVRVESCAVAQFIQKNKQDVWSRIASDNKVLVIFDPVRPKITISGARIYAQKAKSHFQELATTLFADTLTVDKPGAKKYFQSQGSMFLVPLMADFSCVVMLQSDVQDDEEEEEEGSLEGETGCCYCKVQTAGGVLTSVSRADICGLNVDAVVNAANEDLQHIGGLALALLKAAGPKLQMISDDYVSKNGKLRPGDAIVTEACSLPCKFVVHAVGPRYSEFDKKTAIFRLKGAVKESLKQAEMVKCSTVAMPAISSGVFGFPVDLCTETIAKAVREYCDNPNRPGTLTEVQLVDNNDATVRVMAAAINREFSDLGPTMTVPPQTGGKNKGAAGRYHRGRGKGAQSRGGRGGGGRGGGGKGGGGDGGRGRGYQENYQADWGGQNSRSQNRNGDHGGSKRLEQITPGGLKMVLCIGNIQDQTTDVIVNTVAENMNLNQGAVAKAISEAAGENLQMAILTEAGVNTLRFGDVIVTDGYNLQCQKVFHAACPSWDNGGGRAEKELTDIITDCLKEAEKRQMTSLSFPAIGTGNLGFPRDVVSRVLLKEIHLFSRRSSPRHLREVLIVVHPSDNRTVDCFTREFSGETAPRGIQHEAEGSTRSGSAAQQHLGRSQQSSASFSTVSSPSLGVYQMQMGQLTLEVSSGDITKEACDVIVNSSNQNFNLQAGVSKAILDSAGPAVVMECAQIVSSPGYQPRAMILTSGGRLPSTNIIHVVGQNDASRVKDLVQGVLKVCEDNRFSSVAFPALGTGQGGLSPSAVADAMVGAVVDFVRKKHPRFVCRVKILIFQAAMITEFHNSMKKRQGEEVEEKSIFNKLKDSVTSFLGLGSEQQRSADFVLERPEFDPAVFQLCADNQRNLNIAKKRLNELVLMEQAQRTIKDPYLNHLTRDDMNELKDLQRNLTVSIRLDRGQEDQEPKIQLEGLTRDVLTAESDIRNIIRRVERNENLRNKAILVSGLVEWMFQHHNGSMVSFDIHTNLQLEEAFEKKQNVKIKIKSEVFNADPVRRRAVSNNGKKQMELMRKDLKTPAASLPSHWEDMKGSIVKRVTLNVGSQEYNDVLAEVTKTGLSLNIIQIERIQNEALWQSYQLLKKQMEVKNKHTNNEKLLYHGTAATSIDLINSKGFNRSYAGAHGAMFGNGSYFAVDPAYSARGYARPDSQGHKRMYQARVLVGDVTQGTSGMIAPPAKPGNPADLYDSVADRQNNPSMYIIFNDIQAYPEYLLTFT
ncbi:LOW QUALITY PROTEIN: protein mono-ADP-ribosyltransferase PARP14-like [Fundulus heteroclitus]|uniref:LOW QUALITY PROTEIN: protein mono-ADP-ribosyltransferase PARP14-like n=1 Tax=Fundulus heteroclitus TaxID=8078 RepID=UPI00165B4F8D|nr:LOW QUALITY PROTEIN: protein mono-ADP-ribosyltransferase PARP14-like [Fundulus heteroclitus]